MISSRQSQQQLYDTVLAKKDSPPTSWNSVFLLDVPAMYLSGESRRGQSGALIIVYTGVLEGKTGAKVTSPRVGSEDFASK